MKTFSEMIRSFSKLFFVCRVLVCMLLLKAFVPNLLDIIVAFQLVSRPDMTFAVDWVLNNNYLSIYLQLVMKNNEPNNISLIVLI